MSKVFPKFDNPISPNKVEGSNVEYDRRFLELQRLSEGKSEQQYGDVIIEAEEPDWSSMEKLCSQLLSETKDVGVFCLYTQAITAKYGLEGFRAGCEIISKNLEKYWEDIYPKLIDEDGVFDPYYRINALSLLLSEAGILRQLNNSYLLTNGLSNSTVTIRQAVNILQDAQKVEDYLGGKDRLILDIRVNKDAKKIELLALEKAYEYLNCIERICNEKLSNERICNFDAIKKPISIILSYANERGQIEVDNDESEHNKEIYNKDISDVVIQNKDADSNIWRAVAIKNRKDAGLVLEKVCLYFEEFEPSHPAPLFIRRIQHLMDRSFYDIVKDMAPRSLEVLDLLIGSRDIDDNHKENLE